MKKSLIQDNPLVSIVIPCYNYEEYVDEAINSALNQTYRNIEVIVIDDGSTDNSLEIIKSFEDKIRWETGPNKGACAARNRGIQLAKGEFIQLNTHDLLEEIKLMIENINVSRECIFRTNHASNYLPIKGTLPPDKNKLINIIEQALDNKVPLRPEFLRGL